MAKKNWWIDAEFKILVSQAKDNTLPKVARERAWNKIYEEFLIPMASGTLKLWKIPHHRVEPWEIAGEIWKTALTFDLEKQTSSYCYFLTSVNRAISKKVKENNWAEHGAMERLKSDPDGASPQPPEGWYVVSEKIVNNVRETRIAPMNHRIDPNNDREYVKKAEYAFDAVDDMTTRQDLCLPESSPAILSYWDKHDEDTYGITVAEILSLTHAHINAATPLEYLRPIALDYLKLLQGRLTDPNRKNRILPNWVHFSRGSVENYGLMLNESDKDLILATLSRALKLARTQ
jgi:hypothetical protein